MNSVLGLIEWKAHTLLGAGATGRVPVMFAVSTITILAFVWALFIRKPRRHHHKHHWESAPGDEKRRWSPFRMGRRHRRRRRELRANPTLAETGGLPAIRPTDSDQHSDPI